MDIERWKERNSEPRKYAHFDSKVSINDVWHYITKPENVVKHGFYPFIQYDLVFNKYSKNKGVVNKKRKLSYAAHIDRYIFGYYGYMLNEKYNERVRRDAITDSAIAYRTDLGLNNIHFAKRAFDFIRLHGECHIIVGDFTNFFDQLSHSYLKKQLCSLLGTTSLPEDYYAVFKNITKYSTWNLECILKLNGLNNDRSGLRKLNKKQKVLTPDQYKLHKKECIKSESKQSKIGIPQGSPISAVLSNIYMLDFDKRVVEYVNSLSGLYMRYSDDFIIVLPIDKDIPFNRHFDWLHNLIGDIDCLELQYEKTQMFKFEKEKLVHINAVGSVFDEASTGSLNYLGFTFDGKIVTIRDKTVSKYYYRMYRKAKNVIKGSKHTKDGRLIGRKDLYLIYSEKGSNVGNGNFLTYVQRAEEIFGEKESIKRSTKRHMSKIKKAIKSK